MKVQNEFILDAPIDRAWPVLLDIPRVATCLPGATMEPGGDDGVYRGTMKVKLGPVSMAYEGTVRLEEVDEDTRTARIVASAKERKGQGTAAATITNRLEDLGGRTRVVAETDLAVTGRPAQFGRGIMEDVADRMLGEFAKRFEQELLSGGPETDGAAARSPETSVLTPPPRAATSPQTAATSPQTSPQTAGAAEAGSSSSRRAPDVLDMGSLVSGMPAARYAAAAVAAAAAVVAAGVLRRRKRRGVRIDFSYRW